MNEKVQCNNRLLAAAGLVYAVLWAADGRAGDMPAADAAEFTIEARDFDSSNLRVSLPGQPYADGSSCIWDGGVLPNRAEYVLELPVTAEYTLSALYAAEASRPLAISVDGKLTHTGFAGVTGAWASKSAKWEEQFTLQLGRGMHTFLLERDGPMPHICALRLHSSVPFPDGWRLGRPGRSIAALKNVPVDAVRRAIDDMEKDFPGRYDGALHRQALAAFERGREDLLKAFEQGLPQNPAPLDKLLAGVRAALLANPLLDCDRLLVVRRNFPGNNARDVTGDNAGFVPANYLNHTAIPQGAWDNQIAVLSGLRGTPRLDPLYQPDGAQLVRDVRLDFAAERLVFSKRDATGRWAIYGLQSDGSALRQLTPAGYPDLDFFDACYLPSGKLIVGSTANYFGVPCLDGQAQTASLYLLDPETQALRQLTFDQDNDNDPVVMNDGRVMYQRWEYSDIPHYFARRRMVMNPDGTGQLALYGSNSWFPTAYRFAKPVPDHATRMVGIISGHHDFGDCGRLALLDPGFAGGYPFRYRPTTKEWGEEGKPIALTPDVLPAEQTGFVQLIPGWGKPVAGTVCDAIVGDVYRKESPALTTHPYPLSSKYFLVSMKPTPQSLWGIYLVDVFDNATLIAESEGAALFEPQPLAARVRPPVIAERIVPACPTAEVHIADLYNGPGLRGVPRGTIKRLRVFAYHFGYLNKAGFTFIGTQSGWDVKRILGTAAVEADGSACFQIPANTPVSIQPLDSEGRAVQLMRSWMVGMPGERVSCVGCHDQRMATLPPQRSLADARGVAPLKPWHGPPRPFAFAHEVFPVLERYCIGCHDKPATVGPRSKPCFKDPDTAYDTLHPYIHRPGMESDMALLQPMEYHTSTSPLIQLLEKGHHGLRLADLESAARERLYCWIDLNVPRNGSWTPPPWQGRNQAQRRIELAKVFANMDTDPEAEFQAARETFQKRAPVSFSAPPPVAAILPAHPHAAGFPMTADEAQRAQTAASPPGGSQRTVELGPDLRLSFARIPAGEFVMGSDDGRMDERPRSVVPIAAPFWMSNTEVTNAHYAAFDPLHDTRYIDMHYMDRVTPGFIANHPEQPVARISWQQAMEFCAWLSQKSGLKVTLPTEAQWDWAARSGTATPFFYGSQDTDFGRFANLADQSLRWLKMGYDGPSALQRRNPIRPKPTFLCMTSASATTGMWLTTSDRPNLTSGA